MLNNTNDMKTVYSTMDKALYIINITRNVGKSLEYALSILEWYSNTDAEDIELRRLINKYWK